jgi:TPR repeat protein
MSIRYLDTSRMMRFCAAIISFILVCSIAASQASAANRGVAVNIRSSEAEDAPLEGSVELYKHSYALVIGIDAYSNGWPKLSNAIKDAGLIAKQLEDKGFSVELHTDLNSEQLSSVMRKFVIIRGNDPDARLFIWYAGHGHTVDGEGYLVPADAPTSGPQFKLLSYPLGQFGTLMRQALSKHIYAVFDSCFAGTVFSAQRSLPPSAITRATTLPVRQFLTSGDADQTVSDDGRFRELFVRAINGEERSDANGDGYVTASELGMFLGDRVTNLTQSLQTPRFGKLRDPDFDRGDFVFVLPEGATSAKAMPLIQPQRAAPSADHVFWNSVSESNKMEELQAYVSQFPDGDFIALARTRINKLEENIRKTQPREKFKITFVDQDMRASKRANIRETPFPTAPRVGRLDQGAEVWVVGETRTQGGTWYKIARDGAEAGFVYGPLLASVTSSDEHVVFDMIPLPNGPNPVVPAVIEQEPDEPAAPETVNERLSFLVEDLLSDVTDAPAEADTIGITEQAAPAEAPPQRGLPTETAPVTATISESMPSIPSVSAETISTSSPEPASAEPASMEPVPAMTATLSETTASLPHSVEDNAASTTSGVVESAALAPSVEDILSSSGELDDAQIRQLTAAVEKIQRQAQAAAYESQLDAGSASAQPGDSAAASETIAAASETIAAASEAIAAATEATAAAIETPATTVSPDVVTEPTQIAMVTEPVQSAFIRRYVQAAANGNARAQLSLGYMYENGDKVAMNKEEAIKWYRLAADSGEIQAMISLGVMYETGEGVTKNLTEAAFWFRKAASAGDPDAQQSVAFMYESGLGLVQDETEAARWYEKAAMQGKVAAQNNLGRMFQLGIGVPQDMDQAIFWYEKAAAQGSDAARKNLRELLPGN